MKKKNDKIKAEIALSIEKMIVLEKIGFDTSDASMCWVKDPNGKRYHLSLHDEFCYEVPCLDPVPAYTLEDILLKFPGWLDFNTEVANRKPLISSIPGIVETFEEEKKPWSFEPSIKFADTIVIGFGKTPFEAAYESILALHRKKPDIVKTVPKIKK